MTTENVSATVCAQIDSGILEREVVAYLSTTSGGTALGKACQSVQQVSITLLSCEAT